MGNMHRFCWKNMVTILRRSNMATNAELATQVKKLQEEIKRLVTSNGRLRDDVEALKTNYGNLVEGVNKNLKLLTERFRAKA